MSFYAHEGAARQRLVAATLARSPSHVLTVDCDEFVSAGAELRARLEDAPDVPVWSLSIEEVWVANAAGLEIRNDHGWRTHALACCWKVQAGVDYQMLDKKLACRRVPQQVLALPAKDSGVSLLHFGWADKSERAARHARYTQHDGGRFHASAHLRSILWDDARVKLVSRPWPVGPVFDGLRQRFAGAA